MNREATLRTVIGQISNGSDVSRSRITLTHAHDIRHFCNGLIVRVTFDPGQSAREGRARVVEADELSGAVTISKAWCTAIPTCAPGDLILLDADEPRQF